MWRFMTQLFRKYFKEICNMQKNGFVRLACFMLLVLLVAGCSKGPKLVPVKGKVLIDGEPLPNAMIQVCPADGKAAFGRSDADGNFELMSYKEGDGCVTGTHKVVVVAVEQKDATTQLHHAPLAYGDIKMTKATLDIEGPTEDAVIELTWDGNKGPIEVKSND